MSKSCPHATFISADTRPSDPAYTRRCVRIVSAIAILFALSSPIRAGSEGYDPAPVDWAYYEKIWVKDLPAAAADEPRLPQFEVNRAAVFLDDAALKFTRQNRCATCHTNVAYLMARASFNAAGSPATANEIRSLLLDSAAGHQAQPDAYLPMYLLPIASAIMVFDARNHTGVDPRVQNIIAGIWKLQDANGGWHYPTRGFLPLMERDARYVATMFALAAGYAPQEYFATQRARTGLQNLRSFLRSRLPGNDHDKAVLLWASARTPGLLNRNERSSYRNGLLRLQNTDGGWTLPRLGQWPRHDGAPNDPNGPSDGYATALVTLALCENGYRSDREPIRRSIHWLESNQRASGRWFTRSTYSDRFRNYLSNMATAYAVMALDSCRKDSLHDLR